MVCSQVWSHQYKAALKAVWEQHKAKSVASFWSLLGPEMLSSGLQEVQGPPPWG